MKTSALLFGIFTVPVLSLTLPDIKFPLEKVCQEYTIPVNVASTVYTTSYAPFKDSFDVTNFVNDIARRNFSAGFHPFSGQKEVSGVYNISASICSPTRSSVKGSTVLLATHGLGYDRRYVCSTY